MKASGNIFEVIPTEQRVSTSAVNWECNTWDNRDGKGGKGKDGQPLPEKTDDEMMKEQCEHQLYNIGWLKSSSCGNSYQITFTGSVSWLFPFYHDFGVNKIHVEWVCQPRGLLELQLRLYFRQHQQSKWCCDDWYALGWIRWPSEELFGY